MFTNALVSVSDKTGLVDFLKPYVAKGMRVVSTGGTLKHLRENGIQAIDISEQTGFPEVMDGRVKTLHPRVHMAILSRAGNHEDAELLKKEGLAPFDLIIVNLYPFESARAKKLPQDELIEFIDIGGPSMLRAAAKNHDRLAVVCEPDDYAWITGKKELNLADRRRLAGRVFAHTARYDDLIAKTLLAENESPVTLVGSPVAELRYGENPHQKATWYRSHEEFDGLHRATILHGKPLSYNNILDLEAAVGTVGEFETPAAVAVKHCNPCGVGTAPSIASAVERALAADPVSVFGGIIALNRPVDLQSAEAMAKIFLECIIAPSFAPEALVRLKKKKDLRLLEWSGLSAWKSHKEFRTVAGGFLVQEADHTSAWSSEWRVLGERPSPELITDLTLAWKTCARLKSNAIALVASGQTIGLGMGQVNRVDAVEHAIARMKKHHPGATNVVLASDAFFPFPDSIELAAAAGIRWVIQPGGSIRDEEVFSRASELHVNIVLTGVRHFRH
jgi:phosphoribosylaminoimidazolecarboxamide formyltransferase/IMP cyclohydrolase